MDPFTAIAGIGSVIGGLFGGGGGETSNRVNYKRLVKDATAAGFNPLTALRNGGAAGYTVTSSPGLSVGDRIGQVSEGIGNFVKAFDPFEDKLREVQYKTQQQQLQNLQYDGQLKQRQLMFDPLAVSGRRRVTAGPTLGSAALPALTPDTPSEVDTDKVVNPFPVGSGIKIPPHIKSADAAETMFSDPGGWAAAIYNFKEVIEYNRALEALEKGKPMNPYLNAGKKRWEAKKAKNAEREKRIRKDADANRRSLGFRDGW